MEDPSAIATLVRHSERLKELLKQMGHGTDHRSLLASCRAVIEPLDDVIKLITPPEHENIPEFVKKYESLIACTRDILQESDIDRRLVELQREGVDTIMFLEELVTTVKSTFEFLNEDSAARNSLLLSQRFEQADLIATRDTTNKAIHDNHLTMQNMDAKIHSYEKVINDLDKLVEQSLAPMTRLSSLMAGEIGDVTSSEETSQRVADTSCLMHAQKVSPLRVLEEGYDHISYEYTVSGSRHIIRLRDSSSKGFSFTVVPVNSKVQSYLEQHLYNCKSRVEIAAILQEAFNLP